MTHINVSALLHRYCGDYEALAEMLGKKGFPIPTAGAVAKWRQRGSIPGESILNVLLAVELETGRAVSLLAYVTEDKEQCTAPASKGKSKATGELLATFG